MGMEVYTENIKTEKITNSTCVTCTMDEAGIFVDFNYYDDPVVGYDDFENCFAETDYEPEDEEKIWKEALEIGDYLGEKYGVSVSVCTL